MARFFSAPTPEFVDGIFDPNIDLQMQLADKQVESDLLKSQLLSDVPDVQFDYWSFDKDRAEAVKSEYNDKITNLAQAMYENPDDLNKHLRGLRMVQRDLTQDFTNGRIQKLQENAAAYKQFEKMRGELQNPADRQAYLKMVESYKAANEDGGAFKSIFQPSEMFDSRNIFDEFAKSDVFKGLNPDLVEQVFDLSNGKYQIKKNIGDKGLATKKVMEAFRQWWDNDPRNAAYAKSREDYFGQKFFDDNGNYVYDQAGYALNDVMTGVGLLGYNEHTEDFTKKADEFALEATKLANKKAYKKWEDNKDYDFVQYVGNNVVSSPAGSNIQEYKENVEFTKQKMDNIRGEVASVLKQELGLSEDEQLPLEVQVAIKRGNFDYLQNLTNGNGTPMFESTVLNTLKHNFKEEQINMAGIEAVRNDWEKEMESAWEQESQGLTFPEYLSKNEPLFNKHLNDTGAIATTQNFTWEGTGATPKEFQNAAKTIVDAGMHRMYTIDFPQGTYITNKDGRRVDVAGMSLDQMLQSGVVEREPVKVPKVHTTPAQYTEDGQLIKEEEYEMRYKLADGSGYIGFSVSPQSIMPATSYDDDRKLELGMIVDFRGQKRIAKIDDVTTTKLKAFENVNQDMLRTNYYLTKWSNAAEVTVPGGHGLKVRTVKDKNGNVIRQEVAIPKPGGGMQVKNLSDPGVKEALSKILNN